MFSCLIPWKLGVNSWTLIEKIEITLEAIYLFCMHIRKTIFGFFSEHELSISSSQYYVLEGGELLFLEYLFNSEIFILRLINTVSKQKKELSADISYLFTKV